MTDDVDPEMRSDEPEPDQLRIRDVLTLGSMLVGCIVAGLGAGLLADFWLDSSPIGLLVGTAAGIVLAAGGFWFRVRAYLAPPRRPTEPPEH